MVMDITLMIIDISQYLYGSIIEHLINNKNNDIVNYFI